MPLIRATWFGWWGLPGRGRGRAKYSNRNHPRQPPVTVPGYLPLGAARGGVRRREARPEEQETGLPESSTQLRNRSREELRNMVSAILTPRAAQSCWKRKAAGEAKQLQCFLGPLLQDGCIFLQLQRYKKPRRVVLVSWRSTT